MKKMTKLSVLTLLLLSLSGGSVLYAASGDSELAVYLNNKLLKQSGIITGGKAYLPAEQLPDNLHFILATDDSGKSVRIFKPNVNLVLMDGEGQIFGKVRSGVSNKISALVQVDSLETEISELKMTLTDPAGKTVTLDSRQIKEKGSSFWYKSAEYTNSFEVKGIYAIEVFFRTAAANGWTAVAEIQFSTL
ncbi:hypothetical protein [Paenibacillus tepidiphilus]|uniref:hypothetical protein n=1 Tax=Paenibacillus tepidiphilus TaxID=2608683 RepID=UPI00123B0E87|nr:hypothetical protein [Paenibacillus tepidiphilus]